MIRKCTVCDRYFEVDINYIYQVCALSVRLLIHGRSEEDRTGELESLLKGLEEYQSLQIQ